MKRIHTNERTAELAMDVAIREIQRCLGLGDSRSGRRDLVVAAEAALMALTEAFAEHNHVE